MSAARLVLLVAAILIVTPGTVGAWSSETVHHVVTVRLDPERRSLDVEDRFTIESSGALTFEVAPWLTVRALRLDGESVTPQREGNRVRVPDVSAGRHEVIVLLDGVIGDDADGATPGGAVADPQGSYLPGSSAWIADPGKHWFTYDLCVEVPLPNRAVATGRLVDETVEDGIYRACFTADRAGEPPSVFAGPYVIDERHEGGLRIRTYFHPEVASLAEDYLSAAAGYIRRYAERIGAYPYADFHIVSAPLPVGLGFPNLTYIGRMIVPLPFMRSRSLAHEVLHNWWGNAVAVDYDAGNWAEGLTAYMADYALAEEAGDDAARTMRLAWLQNLAALPPEEAVPVARFTAKTHDASQVTGYDKVAFIFHMLAAELGDDAFARGLRNFWNAHRFRVAGWSDLQSAFEGVAERDLAWFFRQWLERAGLPRLELLNARRAGEGDGHRVVLTVRQTLPVYRLRLPVVIETADGSRRTDVVLTEPEQTFDLQTDARPLSVHLDPQFEVLRALLPGESPPIFRDVTLSRATRLVITTAEMAETGHQLARRLLQREPMDHVGDSEVLTDSPVLVIGRTDEVEALRDRHGRFHDGPDSEVIRDRGTARAWVERDSEGATWMFIAADDAEALDALLRPLPHYRGQSYVVFEGAKAIDHGLGQSSARPLSARFDK